MTQDRYVELFEQTKLATAQGDKKAQSLLGAIYSEGSGVAKNYVEAFKYYKLVAEQRIGVTNKDILFKKMSPQQIEEAIKI